MTEIKNVAKTGFVKFDRKIKDWGWYTDVNTFKLFFHLILCANYAESRFRGVKISRGEIVRTLDNLVEETGLTRQNVRTAIKHLENSGEITRKKHRNFFVISIPNYDLYQSDQHKTNTKLTQNQHKANTKLTQREEEKEIKNNNKGRKKVASLAQSPEQKLRFLQGELGGGVVLLSEEQENELLDMLSIEEFDKYVSIVRDCELKGKHFRKPHYQAILEMVKEDRGK